MSAALKAHVRGGRLVLDEPTSLPEGSEVLLDVAQRQALDQLDRALVERVMANASSADLDHFARVLAELRARDSELDLDDAEREELDESLREGLEQAGPGKGSSTEEVFASMNAAARGALSSS